MTEEILVNEDLRDLPEKLVWMVNQDRMVITVPMVLPVKKALQVPLVHRVMSGRSVLKVHQVLLETKGPWV